MTKKYIITLLFLMLLLTGCQGKASDKADGSKGSISGGADSAFGGPGSSSAADNAGTAGSAADGCTAAGAEEKFLYFTAGYDGTRKPVPVSATSADITLYWEPDVKKLAKLTQLKELSLNGSRTYSITDLEIIKGLPNLETLSVTYEDITDISALAELKNLKDLNLAGNKIQDLSPLAGLSGLEELRLQSNDIEDLSPLSGLEHLRLLVLDGNPVRDITPLSGLDSHARLCLRGTYLAWDEWEPVKHMEKVDGRPPVENAGVISCPQAWVDRIHSRYPDGRILSLDYDDYDGNGTYEAFAFVAEEELPASDEAGYKGVFLMLTENSMQELRRDWEMNVEGYFRFGGTKIILLEDYVAVTSSTAYLWTADGTAPRSLNLSGWGQWFYVDEWGNACQLHSAYDGFSDFSGHSYKPYFFYFDGYDFVEYGAIPITLEEFLTCQGAEGALEEIQEEGLALAEILYRSNGMIHLNLRKYYGEEGKDGGECRDAENGGTESGDIGSDSIGNGDTESKNKESGDMENIDERYYGNLYRTYLLSEGQLTLIDSDRGIYLDSRTEGRDTNVLVEYPSGFPAW